MTQARAWRGPAGRRAASLAQKVPRDHRESDAVFHRRRRVVAGVSLAGAGLLGVSLSTRPDSPEFYGLTLGVAGTWVGGGLLSGPLHLGWMPSGQTYQRPVVVPIVLGVAAFGAFYGAALVARHVPVLRRAVTSVLQYAVEGTGPLVLLTTLANGAAEEVFFRGALFAAVGPRYPVAKSTAVYHAGHHRDPQPRAGARLRGGGHPVRAAAPGHRWHPGAATDAPDLVGAGAALPTAAVPRHPGGGRPSD
jgi:uncharacterized protein